MLKTISRIIVGIIFLFSGFVKAVDPVGGAIKISEYLEIIGLHNIDQLALYAAILLSTIEFIIGFQLVLGVKMKKVALPTFLFMAFFTILTLYIALFDPVSDCGCFGDAIKLGNWETLIKNLFILPLSYIIFWKRNDYQSGLSDLKQSVAVFGGVLFIVGISYVSIRNLPLLDFRPFKVGVNMPQGMIIPEGAPMAEYETSFIYEKEGVQKEFNLTNYPQDDTTWVFVNSKSTIVKEGYQPPIENFMLETTDGNDMTEKLLEHEQPVFLMVMPKVEKASVKSIQEFIAIHRMCIKNNYPFYGVTASLADDIYKFDVENKTGFEYLNADETLLKTIVRGNPALVVLDKGTVIAKYSQNTLPTAEELEQPLSYSLQSLTNWSNKLLLAFWGVIMLTFVTTLYRLK